MNEVYRTVYIRKEKLCALSFSLGLSLFLLSIEISVVACALN